MGLTKQSVGMGAVDSGLEIKKQTPDDKIIAIAGNPNVGKSTLFNNLTGMNQHTGNWPGKTVTNAQGYCKTREHSYVLVDIPGTYSLMAHSTEEEVARNFICFGGSDGVVVVCDATCLERNLNLVLQTMEISDRVLVCVNLMDEAARKNITIDLKGLSEKLGVPVAGTIARKKQSLDQLMKQLDGLVEGTQTASPYQVEYSPIIEQAIAMAEPAVKGRVEGKVNSRWLTLKLLDSDPSLIKELREYLDEDILEVPEISLALSQAREHLAKYGITNEILKAVSYTHLEGYQPPEPPGGKGEACLLPHFPEQAVLRTLVPFKMPAYSNPLILIHIVLFADSVEHQICPLIFYIAKRCQPAFLFHMPVLPLESAHTGDLKYPSEQFRRVSL